MTLMGFVCLLSWALAIAGAEPRTSMEEMLRDVSVAPPIMLPETPPAAARREPEADRLAPNIWLQPPLAASLKDTLVVSPAFRALVARIGATPMVHVAVSLDPGITHRRTSRAECEMRTYDSGLVFAHIKLPDTSDAAELTAHELAHVAEWLDGINLRREYLLHAPGVWRLRDGRFESQRAIDAGLRVRNEVRDAARLLTRRGGAVPTDGVTEAVTASRAANGWPASATSRRSTP